MKNSDVDIGSYYIAKVSGRFTVVKITDKGHPKGWCAKNLWTGNDCYFKTGGRLRRLATDAEIIQKGFNLKSEPIKPLVAHTEVRFGKQMVIDMAKAVMDLTDGAGSNDIHYETELPMERCDEILQLRDKLLDMTR